MKILKVMLVVLMTGFCLTVYAFENLYVICSKANFDANYQDISSGGENYSLDGKKVQFSNHFTGEQIRALATDPDVGIYNNEEINSVLNSAEWKESPLLTITIDQKFKDDYAIAANKLAFLETSLGLK